MSHQEYFEVAVIGSGPGGYVAAIKAASEGKKVALIEKDLIGGTCLNWGCIPTKTLIANTDILEKIHQANDFGIKIKEVSFDYKLMKQRKDEVVTNIRKSLEGLIKSHGVTIIKGAAEFLSPRALKIHTDDSFYIEASKIIIATGSTTLDIPSISCDHIKILNSTSILQMESLPQSLIIIGGGYIGCEFASLYASLGVKVTIIEAMPTILSTQGKSISSHVTNTFNKKGIEILTKAIVKEAKIDKDFVEVILEDGKTLRAEKVLVSIGRKIVTEGLNLGKAGINVIDKGIIPVNNKMETEVPGIYAIGDVTGKAMLAHVASHQGVVAASNACGKELVIDYHAVPAVIFTSPEIATVGMTLEEALEKKLPATIGTFPFAALGKAQATNQKEGFAQIVIDTKTRAILGAQVVGYSASTMIGQMTTAIQNELTVECLIETIHPHPTMTEAWLEAALLAVGTPIHLPPKKRG